MRAWITLSHVGDGIQATLTAQGYTPFHDPLLQAMPILTAERPLIPQGAHLIVTSSNALHALEELGWQGITQNPLITLGWHTPQVAKVYGFGTVINAGARAQEIPGALERLGLPKTTPLVYLRGQDVAFALKEALENQGYSVTEVIVYQTDPQTPSPTTQAALRSGDIGAILVGSPKAAAALRDFLEKEGAPATQTRHTTLFYLGDDVARVLQAFPWKDRRNVRDLLTISD